MTLLLRLERVKNLYYSVLLALIGGFTLAADPAGADVIVSAESADIVSFVVTDPYLVNGQIPQAELLSDPEATGGTFARIITVGARGWQTYQEAPAVGRYRITMRARLAVTNGTAILVTAGSSSESAYFYHSSGMLDFNDVSPASGFVDRSSDLLLPGSAGNGYLQVFITGGMDVDWIKMESLPTNTYPAVEVVQAQTEKLFYQIGTNAQAKVRLLNTSPTAQTVRLRVRLESGLSDSMTAYDASVTVPPTGKPELYPVPLGVLAAGGTAVVAETLGEGGQVLSSARDYALSGDSPLEVSPLYGVFSSATAVPVYSSNDSRGAMRELRLSYAAFAELSFWAPCETTMLTSPPGQTNWWSGQTLSRLSVTQLQGYKQAADAHGIGLVAYADYSDTYGWRILEAARVHFTFLGSFRIQGKVPG